MFKTAWVTSGILLGLVLTVSVQWATEAYVSQKASARAQEFLSGYQAATDKSEFVDSFDFDGDGIILDLSSAEGEEISLGSDEDKTQYCQDLKDSYRGLDVMIHELFGEPDSPEVSELIRILSRRYTDLFNEYFDAECYRYTEEL